MFNNITGFGNFGKGVKKMGFANQNGIGERLFFNKKGVHIA